MSFIEHSPFFFSFLGYWILIILFVFFNSDFHKILTNNKKSFLSSWIIFKLKNFYAFFIKKTYFDEIYNSLIRQYLWGISIYIIKNLDNGLLELFGSRGIGKSLIFITFNFNEYLNKFFFNYLNIYMFFLFNIF